MNRLVIKLEKHLDSDQKTPGPKKNRKTRFRGGLSVQTMKMRGGLSVLTAQDRVGSWDDGSQPCSLHKGVAVVLST